MASSQQIERYIMADLVGLITAASISNVVDQDSEQPKVATLVVVRCLNLRSNLAGETVPIGMRQADMAVDCYSYFDDDKNGNALNTLVASVRAVVYNSSIVANLNSQSSFFTYLGMMAGDDLPDEEERYRIKSIQFSLVMRPATS